MISRQTIFERIYDIENPHTLIQRGAVVERRWDEEVWRERIGVDIDGAFIDIVPDHEVENLNDEKHELEDKTISLLMIVGS